MDGLVIPPEMLEDIVYNGLGGIVGGGDNIDMPLRVTNENPMLCIENTIDCCESGCDYH
jgi:hypothetical protein